MPRYDAAGKNRSAMVHASRGHKCSVCGREVFGNGGEVAHGRGHVRRGEAIELLKQFIGGTSRLFFKPDDPRIAAFEAKDYRRVRPT